MYVCNCNGLSEGAVRKEIASIAPGALAQLFSSLKGTGVDEARKTLAGWLYDTDDAR